MSSLVIWIVAGVIFLAGFIIGIFAFRKGSSKLFGQYRVMHLIIGFLVPPLEIILGGIELAK